MADSLYGFVAEFAPHTSAAIILLTNPLTPGQRYTLGQLTEPNVLGYLRVSSGSLLNLFPQPQIVAGKAVRLVSKQIDMPNHGGAAVALTGIALVIWKDPSTPIVPVIVPLTQVWQPGKRIVGNFRITALIHDE